MPSCSLDGSCSAHTTYNHSQNSLRQSCAEAPRAGGGTIVVYAAVRCMPTSEQGTHSSSGL